MRRTRGIGCLVLACWLVSAAYVYAGEASAGPDTPPPASETVPAPTESAAMAKEIEESLPEGWLRETTIWEVATWQWLALLALVLLAVVAARVIRYALAKWLVRWAERRSAKGRPPLDERIIDNTEKPFGYLIGSLLLYGAVPVLGLPPEFGFLLHVAVTIGIAVAGIWSVYRISDLAAGLCLQMAAATESKLDDLLVPLVRRTIKVFVTILGILFIGQNLDINVTGLVAGLGLGGLAFALAAKDTVANFFGSLTILLDQPFRIGDWVKIGEVEGLVEDVGFRTTRIRTFYNSLVSLPNSAIVNTQVDNYGLREYRRLSTTLAVTYDTPPEKVEAFGEGIRELIRLHPYTRKDFFCVRFSGYGASSLDVMLYVFWKVPDWSTEMRERERLLVDIYRLAERLGVSFAFPTQTLHLASLPGSDSTASAGGSGSGEGAAALVSRAVAAVSGQKPAPAERTPAGPAQTPPPLRTAKDFDEAHELGRRMARELVTATLGDPVQVPPPASGT